MSIKTILDFKKMKQAKQAISMLTCYDFTMAQILNETAIDCLLVGDSAAMTMHGHSTTVPATMEMMIAHVAAVVRGAPNKFIVGDLPFLSYRKDLADGVENVALLMQAGAHAIKLEGVSGNLELIRHLVESGVPVMGHIGLTPQSINQLGGFRLQAKTDDDKKLLLESAKQLEEAGCFAVVLECVPSDIAREVSQALDIPTIGIGAGAGTDGQVLVLQDMLGLNPQFKAKFVRHFMSGFSLIKESVTNYVTAVQDGTFPNNAESYHD